MEDQQYFLFGILFILVLISFFVVAQQRFFKVYRDNTVSYVTEVIGEGWDQSVQWVEKISHPKQNKK